MAHFESSIRNRFGEAVPEATVTITVAGTTDLADLFADEGLTEPIPNPTIADGKGIVDFYVANGVYDILIQRFDIEDRFVADIAMGESIVAVSLFGDVTGFTGANTVEAIQGTPVSPDPPDNLDILVYDSIGDAWTPSPQPPPVTSVPVGGDLSGTTATATVTGIQGAPVDPGPPVNGDSLVFDSLLGAWTPVAPDVPVGGDLSGTSSAATVAGLQGTPVAAVSPANGQILIYNSGLNRWNPSNAVVVMAGDVINTSAASAVVRLRGVDLGAGMTTPSDGDLMQYNNTLQEWVPVQPPSTDAPEVILTAGQLVPSSTAILIDNSNLGTLVFPPGGVTSWAAAMLPLPESFYGVNLTIQVYMGANSGFGNETVHFRWIFGDGGGSLNTANLLLPGPTFLEVAEHTLTTTANVSGSAVGGLVGTEWGRDASNPNDSNANQAALYSIRIFPT